MINKWEKEWLGKSFWNSGLIVKSFGVAILIKKRFKYKHIYHTPG